MRATGLARERAQLVRHVNVPLEVLLAGTLAAVFARNGVALLLVVGVAVGWGTASLAAAPWLLGGMVVMAAGVFGLALALADEAQQQMLGADVVVAQVLGLLH